jgi:hypothetical protein
LQGRGFESRIPHLFLRVEFLIDNGLLNKSQSFTCTTQTRLKYINIKVGRVEFLIDNGLLNKSQSFTCTTQTRLKYINIKVGTSSLRLELQVFDNPLPKSMLFRKCVLA